MKHFTLLSGLFFGVLFLSSTESDAQWVQTFGRTPHRRNRMSGRWILCCLAVALALAVLPARASTNRALGLRWPGLVETNLPFSSFFNQSHTVAFRFMPQYPRGYRGAIVSVDDNSGSYQLGQGNYREGGASVEKLVLTVGGTTRFYQPPGGLPAGRWVHLAVVRSNWLSAVGGGTTVHFALYVNGMKLCSTGSSCDLILSTPIETPNGNVRLGRIRDAKLGPNQAYGLVDDVAIFTKALSASEIAVLVAAPRLTGREAGLLAGYTFDTQTPDDGPLPTTLSGWTDLKHGTYVISVSQNRDHVADAVKLPPPNPVYSAPMRLPFKAGQAWKVIQHYASLPSHVGNSAFSLDWVLVGPQSANKIPNPNDTGISCGEPVLASATGTLLVMIDSGGGAEDTNDPKGDGINNDFDGPNFLHIQMQPGNVAVYMHLFTGSVEAAFPDIILWPPWVPGWVINVGTKIGTVGTRNGCHLHTGVKNGAAGSNAANYPTGYYSYEACDGNCDQPANWYHVGYGVPKLGQQVRNP